MIKGMSNEEWYRFYRKTMNGNCDHNCKKCVLLQDDNVCIHKKISMWEKWNEQEHKKFAQSMQVFKVAQNG